MGKKDGKAKGASKKGKRRDTAQAILQAVVERGGGSDVAALCRESGAPLGEVLRSLIDLQRFGLVEVTNGISKPTPLGTDAATVLSDRSKPPKVKVEKPA